ncbi:MAG: methyltransferase family protein [Candidatus Thorarchaeota archaeon]
MFPKGMDKLREKLPDYPGRRIALLPLKGIFVSLVAYLLLILLDVLPRLLPSNTLLTIAEPIIPILGSLLVAALAVKFIGDVWNKRDKLKQELGNLAYQRILGTGLIGVFLLPALIFHGFTSVRSLPPSPPVNDLTVQMSRSLLPLIGVASEVDVWLRAGLCGLFLLLGILTVRSAVMTFGIDYMTVVYLYFPEESEVQQHEIYSVVRHPTYLGVALLGAAALLFRLSVYSILTFIIIYAVLRLQIRREEIELVDRFGDSYLEYMENVPRLLVRARDSPAFIRFLRVQEEYAQT